MDGIVYFYPLIEERADGRKLAAKRHWFQEAVLKVGRLCEDQLWGCGVPPFYYRQKPWKPEILSEAMEMAFRHVEGMADTYVHPKVEAMLTERYCRRWAPRRDTLQALLERLISQYAGDALKNGGEAAVLLGAPEDTDWQMELARELLEPYLPRINRLVIFYEEVAGTDIWMELGSHLDGYYYEYGLVPQLEPYIAYRNGMQIRQQEDTLEQPRQEADNRKCGKTKCGGIILDYGAGFRYPKISPGSSAVYIDTLSIEEKEQILRRGMSQIPYVSPLKYLDTMVKNSYDGLL